MSWIKTIGCITWADYKTAIMRELYPPDGFFHRDKFWFRGHSCSAHKLESSFDRWYNGLDTLKSRDQLAQELLVAFKEEAAWFPEFEKIRESEAKIMALGRHHGLPTRQLDWSESPYVAAFFAFAGCNIAKCGTDEAVIWVLNRSCRAWGKNVGVEMESIDRTGNVRLKYQAGGFTILRSPYANLEEHLAATKKQATDPYALWKFVIPESFAKEALADLDSMGISFASLYSGIDGSVLTARMRVMFGL